eukprot:TRINITY_DN19108_c0_g3_i1.p1 TRINITY_DN19108_c0_g3~~TRINITY_DN19108_c0_g3_i1.p1  ORF type:complete len:618 (+),score=107.33 TRINITY_DN19108_c0_g3_i1:101-1954(+)
MEDGAAEEGVEYEVELILKYRKSAAGDEYFLVKWLGYPVSEATWEPLEHMNENCKELIAKARALFAFRKPAAGQAIPLNAAPGGAPAPAPEAPVQLEVQEVADESPVPASLDGPDLDLVPEEFVEDVEGEPVDDNLITQTAPEDGGVILEDVEEDGDGNQTLPEPFLPPPSDSGPPPPKRQKLQTPTGAPPDASRSAKAGVLLGNDASAAKRKVQKATAPSSMPADSLDMLDEELQPPGPQKRPVVREMKCICGASEKVNPADRDKLIVCRICNCGLHPDCVNGSLPPGQKRDNFEQYVCPPCRLERVDEFHPPVGAGLLRHSYTSASSTFTLSFTAQAAQWKKQQWAVHLRSVALSSEELSGPAWPHKVQGRLNGRQCVAIDPPKHLHVRREQCYNLTPLLRAGLNQLELRFTQKPDKPRSEPDESYCVGVVLTRPRSVASIIARIRTRSTETVQSGQLRVRRLLSQVARKERREEDCTVTGNFGRLMKPLCPVSLCPIEESAIGRHCNHIQVFDLQAYIAVNQRMRSLDKRWTCPVCSLALRPDDIILDPYAQSILDTLRGQEENVEAVVFSEDCSWSTISAAKEKDGKDGDGNASPGEEGEKEAAPMIDLSDSE